MKTFRLPITIAAVAATALLAGCGSGVSGTYTDSHNVISMTFKSGTVTIGGAMENAMSALANSSANSQKAKYKVKGKKVVITPPDGSSPLELEIADDGCLTGLPMIGELCKKKS